MMYLENSRNEHLNKESITKAASQECSENLLRDAGKMAGPISGYDLAHSDNSWQLKREKDDVADLERDNGESFAKLAGPDGLISLHSIKAALTKHYHLGQISDLDERTRSLAEDLYHGGLSLLQSEIHKQQPLSINDIDKIAAKRHWNTIAAPPDCVAHLKNGKIVDQHTSQQVGCHAVGQIGKQDRRTHDSLESQPKDTKQSSINFSNPFEVPEDLVQRGINALQPAIKLSSEPLQADPQAITRLVDIINGLPSPIADAQ